MIHIIRSFCLLLFVLITPFHSQLTHQSHKQHKKSAPSLLIFSAWDTYHPKIEMRIKHHKAYADRHGYSYRLYVKSNVALGQSAGTGVDIAPIGIPPTALRLKYRAGWYKVFAFADLLKLGQFDYFFYLDLDAVFHNFEWPLLDVIKGYDQSIFLQLSNLARHTFINQNLQTSSHVVLLKNDAVSSVFVQKWYDMIHYCPEINMEQGAMFATVAEFYSNYTIPCHCKTKVCPAHVDRKNKAFGDCFNEFIAHHFGFNPVHPHIHVFRFWNHEPRPPLDGFSAEAHWINTTFACPLTFHPFKDFTKEYVPIYNKCSSYDPLIM